VIGNFIKVLGSWRRDGSALAIVDDLTKEQKDKLHEAMGSPPEGGKRRGGGQSFKSAVLGQMDKEIAARVDYRSNQKMIESQA